LDLCGARGTNFFRRAFLRGIWLGCARQTLAPQKAPQNEPSGCPMSNAVRRLRRGLLLHTTVEALAYTFLNS